jgi:hypothetical protein
MNFLIFDLLLTYLISNGYLNIIDNKIKLLSNFHKNYLFEFTNYIKIKSLYLLNKHIKNLSNNGFTYSDLKTLFEINDIPNYDNKNNIIELRRDYKSFLSLFFDFYFHNYDSYNNYKKKAHLYKFDQFDPLKRLSVFKRKEIYNRMKYSINLNLALANADYYNNSFIKARELDEYWEFGYIPKIIL